MIYILHIRTCNTCHFESDIAPESTRNIGFTTVTLDNARNRRFDDGGTEGSPRATNFSIRARSSPFSRSLLLTLSHGRACCPSLVHSFSVSRFLSRVLLSSRRCWRKKEGGMGATATHTSLSRLRTTPGISFTVNLVALLCAFPCTKIFSILSTRPMIVVK